MKTLKRIGLALLITQCLFNVATVAVFLIAGPILHYQDGRFSAMRSLLIWGGAILSIPTVGIFSYATQREQTYQKASSESPEGGKVAQRNLTLAIVAFVSQIVTLYWVL
ncbi:MAG TPA: hypothetical protein VKB38_02010 [Terracidiphilus sp.]|nr:hypothetical protein [Terracidiphilus sp.]